MIFHGVFNDLTTPQAVALLSCFVYDRPKSSNEAPNRLEQEIQGPMRATKVGF
jgi:ATP-dependent RNA helicase DOB1